MEEEIILILSRVDGLRIALDELTDRVDTLHDLYEDLDDISPRGIAQSIGGLEDRVKKIEDTVEELSIYEDRNDDRLNKLEVIVIKRGLDHLVYSYAEAAEAYTGEVHRDVMDIQDALRSRGILPYSPSKNGEGA